MQTNFRAQGVHGNLLKQCRRKKEQLRCLVLLGTGHRSQLELLRLGNYDEIENAIHCLLHQSGRCASKVVLFEMPYHIMHSPTRKVLEAITKAGLSPAGISELLAFGVRYPEQQRFFPIVALRDTAGLRAPMLEGDHETRSLSLADCDDRRRWDPDFRFLCIRR